jgi:hypothetical protein
MWLTPPHAKIWMTRFAIAGPPGSGRASVRRRSERARGRRFARQRALLIQQPGEGNAAEAAAGAEEEVSASGGLALGS